MQMCASVSVDRSRCGPLLDQSETTELFQVSQCWVLNYWSGLPNPGVWSTAPWFSGSIPTHNYRLKSSWRCYCPQQNTNSFKSVLEITVTFQDSVQLLSRVRLFATPWTAAHKASLSITNSWSLLKLMSIESLMPSNHLILCYLLLLPSIFPNIRVFSNESVLRITWLKYWSFSSSISPTNEYSGLISFRIDWFDLLVVQRTLKSSLNTTVQKHQSFSAQLSLWSNSHIHSWLLEKS